MAAGTTTKQCPNLIKCNDFAHCLVLTDFVPDIIQSDENTDWQHFLGQVVQVKHNEFVIKVYVCRPVEALSTAFDVAAKNFCDTFGIVTHLDKTLVKVTQKRHFPVLARTIRIP